MLALASAPRAVDRSRAAPARASRARRAEKRVAAIPRARSVRGALDAPRRTPSRAQTRGTHEIVRARRRRDAGTRAAADEVVRDAGEPEATAATALEEAVTYTFPPEDDECLWESAGEECKPGTVI